MAIDPDQVLSECEEQRDYFDRIGERVPGALEAQRQYTADRVRKAA